MIVIVFPDLIDFNVSIVADVGDDTAIFNFRDIRTISRPTDGFSDRVMDLISVFIVNWQTLESGKRNSIFESLTWNAQILKVHFITGCCFKAMNHQRGNFGITVHQRKGHDSIFRSIIRAISILPLLLSSYLSGMQDVFDNELVAFVAVFNSVEFRNFDFFDSVGDLLMIVIKNRIILKGMFPAVAIIQCNRCLLRSIGIQGYGD